MADDDTVRAPEISSLPLDEHDALAGAVREAVHRRIIDLIERRNAEPLLVNCSACGERAILLDEPATFVYDRSTHTEICSACAAERAVTSMYEPQVDIGGEGGG